jgi:hypothetical protein
MAGIVAGSTAKSAGKNGHACDLHPGPVRRGAGEKPFRGQANRALPAMRIAQRLSLLGVKWWCRLVGLNTATPNIYDNAETTVGI